MHRSRAPATLSLGADGAEPRSISGRLVQLARAHCSGPTTLAAAAAAAGQPSAEQLDAVWREGATRHAKVLDAFLGDEAKRCCFFSVTTPSAATVSAATTASDSAPASPVLPLVQISFTLPAASTLHASEIVLVLKSPTAEQQLSPLSASTTTLASRLVFFSLAHSPGDTAASMLARLFESLAPVLLHQEAPKDQQPQQQQFQAHPPPAHTSSNHDPPRLSTNHPGVPLEIQHGVLEKFQAAQAELQAQAATSAGSMATAAAAVAAEAVDAGVSSSIHHTTRPAAILLPLAPEATLTWAERNDAEEEEEAATTSHQPPAAEVLLARASTLRALEHLVQVTWATQVQRATRRMITAAADGDQEEHYGELKCIVACDASRPGDVAPSAGGGGAHSRHPPPPPTPLTEVAYWRRRSSQLVDLRAQLASPAVARVESILKRAAASSASAAHATLTELAARVTAAQEEARARLRHLERMEPYLAPMQRAGESEAGLRQLVRRDLPCALRVLELGWFHLTSASSTAAPAATTVAAAAVVSVEDPHIGAYAQHPSRVALMQRLLANEVVEQGRAFLRRVYHNASDPPAPPQTDAPSTEVSHPAPGAPCAAASTPGAVGASASFFDPSSPISGQTTARLELVERVATVALELFAAHRTRLHVPRGGGGSGVAAQFSLSASVTARTFSRLHTFLGQLRALLALLRSSRIFFHLAGDLPWTTHDQRRIARHIEGEAREAMEEFLGADDGEGERDAAIGDAAAVEDDAAEEGAAPPPPASSFDPTDPSQSVAFRHRLSHLRATLSHLLVQTGQLFQRAFDRAGASWKERLAVLESLVDYCDVHMPPPPPEEEEDRWKSATSVAATSITAPILHVPSLLLPSASASTSSPPPPSLARLLRGLHFSLLVQFHAEELDGAAGCQEEYLRVKEVLERAARGQEDGTATAGAAEATPGAPHKPSLSIDIAAVAVAADPVSSPRARGGAHSALPRRRAISAFTPAPAASTSAVVLSMPFEHLRPFGRRGPANYAAIRARIEEPLERMTALQNRLHPTPPPSSSSAAEPFSDGATSPSSLQSADADEFDAITQKAKQLIVLLQAAAAKESKRESDS